MFLSGGHTNVMDASTGEILNGYVMIKGKNFDVDSASG